MHMQRWLLYTIIIVGVISISFAVFTVATPKIVHARMVIGNTDYCLIRFGEIRDADILHDKSQYVEVSIDKIKAVPKLMEAIQKADERLQETIKQLNLMKMEDSGCYYAPNTFSFDVSFNPGYYTELTADEYTAIRSALSHAIVYDTSRKEDLDESRGFTQPYVIETVTTILIKVDGKHYRIDMDSAGV